MGILEDLHKEVQKIGTKNKKKKQLNVPKIGLIDSDNDKVPDIFDCAPLDKTRQGPIHRNKKPKTRPPKLSEMEKLEELLKEHGDVPEEVAEESTENETQDQWIVVTQNGKIIGAGRVKKTDWYEHTLKNIFVTPEAREQKVGTLIYKELTDKAEDEGAKVAEADITSTNVASKIPATRAGMRRVNTFKWDEDDPPADIYHEVFMKPSKTEVRAINRRIRRGFQRRGKKVPENIYTKYNR